MAWAVPAAERDHVSVMDGPLPSKSLVMELETGGGDVGGCGGGDDLHSDGGAPASVHEQ